MKNEKRTKIQKRNKTKSTVNDLDTSILDFFLLSKIVTIWQTDGTAYKLKPRSFHKSTHF